MINDIESLSAVLYKTMVVPAIAVLGWFCRDIIKTQRETDVRIHNTELHLKEHQLYASQNYHTKQDAATMRMEHREEIKRVHDRLDSLPQEIANLLRKP
jgi:hypothetical protein